VGAKTRSVGREPVSGERRVDLYLKARGVRLTEQFKAKASQKAAKLSRIDPRAARIEIEVTSERNPRLNGIKRLEGTLSLPRHVLRASASAQDIDSALDILVDRLERQIRDYRAKRKKKLLPGANPLKSPRIGPSGRDEEA